MSDDSFIREVEEELRSDRAKSIWNRYGKIIIGIAVAIIIAVAANTAWNWYADKQASASGDRFLEALTLANEGKNEEALAALGQLQEDGYGQYPVLARMRAATVQANDDAAGAAAAFDTISADTSVPVALRDIAKLRAAYLMVDLGSYADVAGRAETLSADGNPLRHGAREALGLAAWKEKKYADAHALFKQISDDETSPPPARQRANMMLDLIRATGEVTEG